MNNIPLSPVRGAAETTLNHAAAKQQADLASRLMRMAVLGVPRCESDKVWPTNLLALHALITAYMALASADHSLTETAASVCFDVSDHLMQEHQRRESHSSPAPLN